jgi:predicted PurR-regulated permease PerM
MTEPIVPSGSPAWSQTTRAVVSVILFLMLIWLLIIAMPLVEALVIAALLAFLLNPLVNFFTNRTRMRRSFVVILVYGLTLLIVASLPATIGALAFGQFRNLSISLTEAVRELQEFSSQPIVMFGFRLSPQTIFQDVEQALGGILTLIPGGSFNILSGLTTNILWGLVIVISLYYFLKDGPQIKPWLVSLCPAEYQSDAQHLMDEIEEVWGIFLRVQIFIFIVIAILFILGSVLVIILYRIGLIPFSWIGLAVMLVLVYALVQQVDNLWLRPQMMGARLRLHPAVVFVGLVGALALSGVLGAIIVVPAIATGKVLASYIHAKMLGIPPWIDADKQDLSQRDAQNEDDRGGSDQINPFEKVDL